MFHKIPVGISGVHGSHGARVKSLSLSTLRVARRYDERCPLLPLFRRRFTRTQMTVQSSCTSRRSNCTRNMFCRFEGFLKRNIRLDSARFCISGHGKSHAVVGDRRHFGGSIVVRYCRIFVSVDVWHSIFHLRLLRFAAIRTYRRPRTHQGRQ